MVYSYLMNETTTIKPETLEILLKVMNDDRFSADVRQAAADVFWGEDSLDEVRGW
jgi:hypothetical protein